MSDHDEPKRGSIREALDAIREAGGFAWDDIDDPEAYLVELRGECCGEELDAANARIAKLEQAVGEFLDADDALRRVEARCFRRGLTDEELSAAMRDTDEALASRNIALANLRRVYHETTTTKGTDHDS